MEEKNTITIGLFGYGVVGKGLFKLLNNSVQKNIFIKKICIKQAAKIRDIDSKYFTSNAVSILTDNDIDIIVEVTDDTDAAFSIVEAALQNKKPVISANKKMIVENYTQLIALQQQYQTPILYEAACGASIPIISAIKNYYNNQYLHSISGIINGSTNYILTKICTEKITFTNALLLAQQAGFAESNPIADISGQDAANKLCIILAHAFDIVTTPNNFLYTGIQQINEIDVAVAVQNNHTIKLVANACTLQNGSIAAYVLPQFIAPSHDFYNIKNEYNAFIIENIFGDTQIFKGKGAGAIPTASAILNDICSLKNKCQYKKINNTTNKAIAKQYFIKIFVSTVGIQKIPQQHFEWIEAYHQQQYGSWLIGVIHVKKLVANNWWKKQGISLITYPNSMIENIEEKAIKKRSMQLASIM